MSLLLLFGGGGGGGGPAPEVVTASYGNCYVSVENLVATATSVTIDNLDASTDAENVCDGRLATVVRANAADTVLTVKVDLGSEKAVRGFFVGGLGDLPADSTVRVCLSNTAVTDEELLDETVTVTLPSSRAQVMVNLTTSIAAQYCRVEVNTPGGTGFTVEIGWLWIARADFSPTIGFRKGAKFGPVSRTLVQTTEGGVRYTDYRRALFQWTFGFEALSAAEAMESAIDIDVDRDVRKPVLFVPHRTGNSSTNLNREALLGTFVAVDPIDLWANVSMHAKTYAILEALAADETVAWS